MAAAIKMFTYPEDVELKADGSSDLLFPDSPLRFTSPQKSYKTIKVKNTGTENLSDVILYIKGEDYGGPEKKIDTYGATHLALGEVVNWGAPPSVALPDLSPDESQLVTVGWDGGTTKVGDLLGSYNYGSYSFNPITSDALQYIYAGDYTKLFKIRASDLVKVSEYTMSEMSYRYFSYCEGYIYAVKTPPTSAVYKLNLDGSLRSTISLGVPSSNALGLICDGRSIYILNYPTSNRYAMDGGFIETLAGVVGKGGDYDSKSRTYITCATKIERREYGDFNVVLSDVVFNQNNARDLTVCGDCLYVSSSSGYTGKYDFSMAGNYTWYIKVSATY